MDIVHGKRRRSTSLLGTDVGLRFCGSWDDVVYYYVGVWVLERRRWVVM